MTDGLFARPDYELVAGFRFRCLPGCGLCCYTTPAVAPSERSRLIQFDPMVPLLETSDGWTQITSRSEGGACYFLREGRCECHAVRPATCGEFPLTAHVSERIQVSVVLSCPGVDLSALVSRAKGAPLGPVSSDLTSEIEYVNREVVHAEATGQLRWALRRRRNVEHRLRRKRSWQSEEEVRVRLRPQIDRLVPTELSPPDPPEEEDALESLPMFYDAAFGRVVWRPHPGGMEFFTLYETGGIDRHLGVLDSPTRSPGLDASGTTLLQGYLSYLLERDATIGMMYEYLLEAGPASPEQVVADELQLIAGQVIRMACLRRALTSDRRGELSRRDIEDGIRATDMDILDRPTVGLRL
jgi:Fe-S-cluster containining protein